MRMILDLTEEKDDKETRNSNATIESGENETSNSISKAQSIYEISPWKETSVPTSQSISVNEKDKDYKEEEDDEDDLLLFGSPIFKPRVATVLSTSQSNEINSNIANTDDETPLLEMNKNRVSTHSHSAKTKTTEKEKQRQIRKEQKELRKAEREMAKQLEQQNKRKLVQQEKQVNGKFCSQEIGVYMEENLASNEDFGDIMVNELRDAGYSVKIAPKPKNPKHMVDGCIQWVRRDHLMGGSESALQRIDTDNGTSLEWMNIVVFVFYDSTEFLSLLEQEENDIVNDCYPKLQSWLRRVRSSISKQKYEQKPRIILVLHQILLKLALMWKKGGKRRPSFSPTNEEELQDAMTWLLMEEQIECEVTTNYTETIEFIISLTRALSELPYYETPTELHCVKKLKTKLVSNQNPTSLDKAKDCWKRQLQQIPGISEAKATYLASFYPTARSLMDKYEDTLLTEEEKRVLLSGCIQEGRMNGKLSDCLYRFMTGTNENELIL